MPSPDKKLIAVEPIHLDTSSDFGDAPTPEAPANDRDDQRGENDFGSEGI